MTGITIAKWSTSVWTRSTLAFRVQLSDKLTGCCALGQQQGVVVWQAAGVEHVEARDKRGWRAVHPLLLRRLHAVCRVQCGHGGVSAGATEVMKAAESAAAFTTVPKQGLTFHRPGR